MSDWAYKSLGMSLQRSGHRAVSTQTSTGPGSYRPLVAS